MLTRRLMFTTCLTSLACAAPAAQAGLALIDQPGFDLLNREDVSRRQTSPTRALMALSNDGPEVRVSSPRSDRVSSPVNFDVTFVARHGAKPALETLKIEYSLGPIWRDVTRKVLAAARIDGFRLRASGARLPQGRHVLRMRIRDTVGRETATRIELTVV